MYDKRGKSQQLPPHIQSKIESFNNDIRQQYREHLSPHVNTIETKSESKNQSPIINFENLNNDDLILIALIVLLLFEETKDYVLIGVLAALLFLKS